MQLSEIKQMKSLKKDIVEICPIMGAAAGEMTEEGDEAKSLKEEFCDFYQESRGVPPEESLVDLFLSLCNEEAVSE